MLETLFLVFRSFPRPIAYDSLVSQILSHPTYAAYPLNCKREVSIHNIYSVIQDIRQRILVITDL
jgi:hypothetical protein